MDAMIEFACGMIIKDDYLISDEDLSSFRDANYMEEYAEKNLIAASEKDIFLYRQMGASYLCIASKAEVDFNKGLGIASATFANVIIGKHGGAIKELGDKKLDEKKLYNAGTFQIVGSALNICPESIPKKIKKDYDKKLKQLLKQGKK